jgi:molybdopterin-guanine dinucleotide biosynthesis protein A
VPLLKPDFIRRVVALSAGHDAAVPHVDGYDEPLSAVYRTGVLPQVEALLAADRLRPVYLFNAVRTRRILPEELADVDPGLESLANVNTPEEYRAALRKAGLRVPPE